jgi:hypothetical protein
MDHLPLPLDPIDGHPTIVLRTEHWDDPGPFLTYPDRHGDLLTGRHPHVPSQANALDGHYRPAVSSYDILNYFQGFLFFSLLNECLGDLYSPMKYIHAIRNEDGSVKMLELSTKSLNEDLAAWTTTGPLAGIQEGDEYDTHLKECLDIAAGALRYLDRRFPGLMEAFPEYMICLASIGEALDSTITSTLVHKSLHAGGETPV